MTPQDSQIYKGNDVVPTPTHEEIRELKCRRCGMLIKECSINRWEKPLCVVDGSTWDEHVVSLSLLLSTLEEVKGETPKVESYLKHDPGSPLRIAYVDGAMEAERRFKQLLSSKIEQLRQNK